jgi:hypothetical protein
MHVLENVALDKLTTNYPVSPGFLSRPGYRASVPNSNHVSENLTDGSIQHLNPITSGYYNGHYSRVMLFLTSFGWSRNLWDGQLVGI